MPTVLIYTSPARGHLYPMMDVALELRARGHRVVVQTLADEAATLAAAGIEHRPIHPRIEALPLEDHQFGNPLSASRHAMSRWLARAPFEQEDLAATTADLRPDLLVVDANTWGAATFAEAQRRPWASFLPYVLPAPSRDAPAFGPGFAPPRGPFDRLRDRFVWWVFGLATAGLLAELNRMRAAASLPPLPGIPALYTRADRVLYRTAEPFEYPRSDWPAPIRAIGPGLWAPPGDLPAWIADLPRPRVLVSVSTEYQADDAIVTTALDSLGGGPGSVVVTTAALDPARFRAPGQNVRITRFLPHAAVVPHMDVVVTHGGMGTTQRCLAAGVPMVVVPWGRDQNESARRVEECGAGVRLPRSRLSATSLRESVQTALARRSGAGTVARAFREAGGARRGVEILEELLSS